MAAPKTTIWDLEPHTRAKHEILKRYLQAWVPILSQGKFPQIVYIDGFAGPGRYSKGEDGSPIIALRAALEQRIKINTKIFFLFVEKEVERARVLQEIVNSITCPTNFRVKVAGGQMFENAFADLLRFYTHRGKPLPPTFAFIDPFGWTGAPFSAVRTIMSYPSCEVLVTFMYGEINRFIGQPDQEANFNSFFGTSEWRKGIGFADPRVRNQFLHDLYLAQLRNDARAKYVRSFQMRNEKDVTDYYLFYATNSLRGLQKMKEAMWKVDESGEFVFSDATNPDQLVLIAKAPRFNILERQILDRFGGRETTVSAMEGFVLAETAFRETHYKVQVLKRLEEGDPPMLDVIDAPAGRKRGTYGNKSLRLRSRRPPES